VRFELDQKASGGLADGFDRLSSLLRFFRDRRFGQHRVFFLVCVVAGLRSPYWGLCWFLPDAEVPVGEGREVPRSPPDRAVLIFVAGLGLSFLLELPFFFAVIGVFGPLLGWEKLSEIYIFYPRGGGLFSGPSRSGVGVCSLSFFLLRCECPHYLCPGSSFFRLPREEPPFGFFSRVIFSAILLFSPLFSRQVDVDLPPAIHGFPPRVFPM